MGKELRGRVTTIFCVILAAIYCTFPVETQFNKILESMGRKPVEVSERINLGLDLKGGMHLILQVDTDELDENSKKDAVPRAIEILRNRIDGLGVGETVIAQQGEDKILVQLPGITDRELAKRIVGQVAKLELRLVAPDSMLAAALKGNIPSGYELKTIKKDGDKVLVEKKVSLSGEAVADASVDFDQMNQPYVRMSFNSQGTKKFGNLTKNNIGRKLAIILDDEVKSAPVIQDAIYGNGQISGDFTLDEASVLALALRSGSLPAPMHVEEERTIGPLLGQDSINSGINATIFAGVLVLIFMSIYYLSAGLISCIALALNLLFIFGSMGFLSLSLPENPLTLTLPGIAGIILTLGMAVDANVLINERIREELKSGKNIKAAVNAGFDKALKAILDSIVTTIIAAIMLFQFGSGPIKGFAVTLSIGLIVSLFTAMYVTKTIFLVLLDLKLVKSLPMLRLLSKTKIDFVSKRQICYVISGILLIGSFVTLYQKGSSAYGIDFVGGQIQQYKFQTPVEADEIRTSLKNIGMEDARIQKFEQYPDNIIVRTAEDRQNEIKETFAKDFPDNPAEVLRIEKVGPVVGKALRRDAILAFIFALAGILTFVGFRFRHFDFATAGVVALLHDVIVTLGILVFLGRQVDLLVLTALLTIAGYSINDTIIIYDRVRENLSSTQKKPLAEIINYSINQTLSRTILTTITTLIVVITLFFKGGEVLNTFALTLMIGFIAGTYSTIFIASPIVLAWQKKSKK